MFVDFFKKRGEFTMSKIPIEPNAIKALNQMKYEIADELGIDGNWTKNKGTMMQSYQNILFAGHVGGNMTRKLIEMGEKQLLNQHRQE
jgi:hypothetical protein